MHVYKWTVLSKGENNKNYPKSYPNNGGRDKEDTYY